MGQIVGRRIVIGADHLCELAMWKRGGEGLPFRAGSRLTQVRSLKFIDGDGSEKVSNRYHADERPPFGDAQV